MKIEVIQNLTPSNFDCGLGPACPSVFEINEERFAIIGKKSDFAQLPSQIANKIGEDEAVVLIPKELLSLINR